MVVWCGDQGHLEYRERARVGPHDWGAIVSHRVCGSVIDARVGDHDRGTRLWLEMLLEPELRELMPAHLSTPIRAEPAVEVCERFEVLSRRVCCQGPYVHPPALCDMVVGQCVGAVDGLSSRCGVLIGGEHPSR